MRVALLHPESHAPLAIIIAYLYSGAEKEEAQCVLKALSQPS